MEFSVARVEQNDFAALSQQFAEQQMAHCSEARLQEISK